MPIVEEFTEEDIQDGLVDLDRITGTNDTPETPVPQSIKFEDAVLDMGSLFKRMKQAFGISHTITLDIVRLQLMYMQQSNPDLIRVPATAPDVVKAVEAAEEAGEIDD